MVALGLGVAFPEFVFWLPSRVITSWKATCEAKRNSSYDCNYDEEGV